MQRASFSKLLPALLLLLWAALGATPAAAQAGITGQPVKVCILRAGPGMTPQGLFASPGRFNCIAEQDRYQPGDFWVLSEPIDRAGPVSIRIASMWQRAIAFHALYADGKIASTALDQQGIARHIVLGAIIEQPLSARPAPLVRLLWHVEGAPNLRGILRAARIATPEQSVRSNLLMAGLYSAFAGLCIALLCYNLTLWVVMRHSFQLAYCAMVLGLLFYALSSSGALAWLWPQLANNDRIRFNYLSLGLAAVAGMVFARTFFEPRLFYGYLDRLITAACILMFVASLGYSLLGASDIWLFDRFFSWAIIAQITVVIPILWRAWRMRSNYLWLFAVAWGAPLVLAGVRAASAFGLIAWSFWLDNSTLISMTLEALLSSLAIAYRIRLLSAERDAARDGEVAALLLAELDPLTGLLNRRAFLAAAIGRTGEQMLMIADLDHFKLVNETIGHDGGDEVLRAVARTLRAAVPEDALVARIGGEEFAIVLPVGTTIEPRDILEQLRAARMPYDVAVTASIGICVGPLLREPDWKKLYACADRALFDAKAAGRDRARDRLLPDRMAA